jgi:nucleotide-binding universal stress UspA family protein
MDHYKRLMVGLEMIPADHSTIRYAAKLSRMAGSEKVYFVHVVPSLDLPEEISQEFPEVANPLDESVETGMREMVAEHFINPHPGAELEFDAVEGPLLRQLMKFAKQKLVDMIVVGREIRKYQRDLRLDKVIRKAPCSVLLVPEGALSDMERILAPVDFSPCSGEALKAAVEFARATDETSKVDCLAVYSVPTGFYKTGKSFEEFAEIMKGNAEKRYGTFIAGIDTAGVEVEATYVCNEDVPEAILGHALASGADLLVIGGRGHTGLAAMLLGSNSEQVIRATTIPTLVVKGKGASLDIIDALLEI